MVDYKTNNRGEICIEQAQLTDFEDAAIVPEGHYIIGKQTGNWMWRSPEARAVGPVDNSSDIFSFGIVVSQQSFSISRNSKPYLCTISVSTP